MSLLDTASPRHQHQAVLFGWVVSCLTSCRLRWLVARGRFSKNLAWRAYGFYFMYALISFVVVLLIVGLISPKHPAPADWPEWTIQYVLGQLESLQTMEFDALYVPRGR